MSEYSCYDCEKPATRVYMAPCLDQECCGGEDEFYCDEHADVESTVTVAEYEDRND